MRHRRVFSILLSLYLWGFILYQVFPVRMVPYVNYAPRELYPKPVVYRYIFAYDVKTAFSNHTGSIKNLLSTMEKEGFDIAFADVPQRIEDKLFSIRKGTTCEVIRVSRIGWGERLVHTLFERLPKTIVGKKPDRLLSRRSYRASSGCWLLAHDERVLISTFWGLEIPSYRRILGAGKNLFLSRDVLFRESYREEFLKGSIISFTDKDIRVFAYSERSFYLPGEKTVNPFKLVVEANLKNPLILLYRDGSSVAVYDRDRVNVKVSTPGKYSVKILTYKFRIDMFYFGLRTAALSSPIELI